MTETERDPVLRRKLAASAPDPALALAGLPSVEKAMGLAMARVSDRLMEMPLTPGETCRVTRSLAEFLDEIPENGLYALLEGPDEAQGVMVLDTSMMGILIEQQTTGTLVAADPGPRRPTRTDAALCADWIDGVLGALEETFAEAKEASWLSGFGFSSHLADPRPLGLMLEDEPYTVLRFEVAVAGGARGGGGMIVLPALGRAPEGRPVPQPGASGEPEEPEDWGPRIEAHLMEAELPLRAVLHRSQRTIAQVISLKPGDLIALPDEVLDEVELVAADGSIPAEGRLGQSHGMRAVRIGTAGHMAEQDPDTLGSAMASMDALAEAQDMGDELPDMAALAALGADPADLGDLATDPEGEVPDFATLTDDAEPGLHELPALPELEGLDDLDTSDLPDLGDLAGGEAAGLPSLDIRDLTGT